MCYSAKRAITNGIEATDRRPSALVLAPTRELVSQIVDAWRPIAHARALKIAAVYGGVGIAKQIRQAAGAHILVATPGRLDTTHAISAGASAPVARSISAWI